MNQQERSSLLQSIGKYIKSQFSSYERRLELAEQKAAQALALDVDARVKLATIEAVKSVTESMRAELAQAKQEVADATKRANDLAASLRQPEHGKSVTAEDVLPLLEALVSKRFAEIPAPKDGKSVPPDDVRPIIEEVVKREVEALPRPQDGRDALQLEILPAIDPEKSYPRGSYAKHAGGLWRAFEQTHGMRGWEVIVEGLAEHRIEQIDERTFEAVSVLSSGAEVRKSVSIPVVIDRGVFKADSEYKAGDGVTWGGSYWIATKDEPAGKPGEPGSDGWRLAVKRGRDGKDGRNGIDKTAPVRIDK